MNQIESNELTTLISEAPSSEPVPNPTLSPPSLLSPSLSATTIPIPFINMCKLLADELEILGSSLGIISSSLGQTAGILRSIAD